MEHHIHAGLTKAGSTSIHNFLERNTEALLRDGLLYPIDTQGSGNNIDRRLGSMIEAGRLEELRALVAGVTARALDEGARAIVWPRSVTGIIGPKLAGPLIEVFRNQGRASRIGVVMYFRNWYDRMISLLNQEEKTAGQICGDHRLDRIAGRASNPSALVAGWEALVGEDQVDIRMFETAVKAGLEQDFLSAMGFEWNAVYERIRPMNTSLDPITVRVINLLRQEWALPEVHRNCERASLAYPMPSIRTRFITRLTPLIEATDFSHPKLARHRELLTRPRMPDLSSRPDPEDFLDDLIGSLEAIKTRVERLGGIEPRRPGPTRRKAKKRALRKSLARTD